MGLAALGQRRGNRGFRRQWSLPYWNWCQQGEACPRLKAVLTRSRRRYDPLDWRPDRRPDRRHGWRAIPWLTPGVISAGGVLGALARQGIWAAFGRGDGFDWTTLCINIAGCGLIGVLMTVLVEVRHAPRLTGPFLGVGVLGGFTTLLRHHRHHPDFDHIRRAANRAGLPGGHARWRAASDDRRHQVRRGCSRARTAAPRPGTAREPLLRGPVMRLEGAAVG